MREKMEKMKKQTYDLEERLLEFVGMFMIG
jgi:hypothetical protein